MGNTWIISASLKDYDLHSAFEKYAELDWHLTNTEKSMEVGDIVYIYISEPEHCIRYKCEVTKCWYEENEIIDREFCKTNTLNKPPYKRLKKLLKFNEGILPVKELKEHGINNNLQGPQRISDDTRIYIEGKEK